MLDHLREALAVVVGAWRFLLSRSYRERKRGEWRQARPTSSGIAVMAGEILAAIVIGVVAPLWLMVVLISGG